MAAITVGMPFLVLFMLLVMGIPFSYYLKRDREYDAMKSQSESVRVNMWYGN